MYLRVYVLVCMYVSVFVCMLACLRACVRAGVSVTWKEELDIAVQMQVILTTLHCAVDSYVTNLLVLSICTLL